MVYQYRAHATLYIRVDTYSIPTGFRPDLQNNVQRVEFTDGMEWIHGCGSKAPITLFLLLFFYFSWSFVNKIDFLWLLDFSFPLFIKNYFKKKPLPEMEFFNYKTTNRVTLRGLCSSFSLQQNQKLYLQDVCVAYILFVYIYN